MSAFRLLACVVACGLLLPAAPVRATPANVAVTDQAYVRHDGGTDASIASCGSDVSTPESGGDDGGNRQQNEPSVAINPSDPNVVVAAANDYCTRATTGDVWMGLYVSTDGGQSWIDSLNPGYPTDTSEEGRASPIFGRAGAAGDPLLDWDNESRLFFGGISFNRSMPNASGSVMPSNGDVIVSTWVRDPSAPLGLDYVRTAIVGKGTPSPFFLGHFNDKPSMLVDDWTASPHEGTVYVAWTLFVAAGENKIFFARSTDHGATFSKPIALDKGSGFSQGTDVAVAPDGTVYVVWRTSAGPARDVIDQVVYVKSTDGGRTFTAPATVSAFVDAARRDLTLSGSRARDCGDGLFECHSGLVFHRARTLPQAVADASGAVSVSWEQVVPAADNGDTYRPDGQAQVVVSRSGDGGTSWSAPAAVDPQASGHQWWPNLAFDRSTGTLALVYFDSRTDPGYSPHLPPGNLSGGTSVCGVPASVTCDVVNAFVATSTDGGATWSSTRVSDVGHQPEYEMFGDEDVPFHGDYLWVDAVGGSIHAVWVDNRDVVPGVDVREAAQDGFDVLQCRTDAASPNTCPNAGGLNQNIYGARVS